MNLVKGRILMRHRVDGSPSIDVRCYDCPERIVNMFRFMDFWGSNGKYNEDGSIEFEISDVFDTFLTSEEFGEKCQCEGGSIECTMSEKDMICSYRKTREQ